MHAFRAPETSLGDLDAKATASLIAAAADIALVVDAAGVIRDFSVNSEELSRELAAGGGKRVNVRSIARYLA